jgi:hypothetical protein
VSSLVRSLCAVALLQAAALSIMATPAAAADLDRHRWSERVLLVFAPDPDDPALAAFETQAAALSCQLQNRDVVIYRYTGVEQGVAYRRALGIPGPDFVLVLVGKDGSGKYRTSGRPDLERVLALIDGMPMRRGEASGDAPCGPEDPPRAQAISALREPC